MKTKIFISIIGMIFFILTSSDSYSQDVTIEEASVIAQNWINMVIDQYGSWNNNEKATPGKIQTIEQDGELLGYSCQVKPAGFIIIAIRKDIEPIKAYNEYGSIDMTINNGLPDLIKIQMSRVVNAAIKQYGAIGKTGTSWEKVYSYKKGSLRKEIRDNKYLYFPGDTLITSKWHQRPPYNNFCPDLSCSTTSNGRALVGCVATAASQIMRYWNWPVKSKDDDIYDWENMKDEVATSSPQAEKDAVAELCHDIGVSVDMDYGCGCDTCDGSSAVTANVKDALTNNYYYSGSCSKKDRWYYSAEDWFSIMQDEFNNCRPIQYALEDHSIVADGWREIDIIKQYHMNYGWGGAHNAWYILDSLHLGNPDKEYMLVNIMPVNTIGRTISGTYDKPWFYPFAHYFDQDAKGSGTFKPGQDLQVKKDIYITSEDKISFEGSETENLNIYSIRGSNGHFKGIKISNGKVVLYNTGKLKY